MGYTCHHAIIVTSGIQEKLLDAYGKIVAAQPTSVDLSNPHGCWVSPVSPRTVNGEQSFFIAPDGSNEGWVPSDKGDAFRDTVIEILDSYAYEDGSNSLKYAELQYGDDNNRNHVIRANRHG